MEYLETPDDPNEMTTITAKVIGETDKAFKVKIHCESIKRMSWKVRYLPKSQSNIIDKKTIEIPNWLKSRIFEELQEQFRYGKSELISI